MTASDDRDLCPGCGEERRDYSPCACSFTPRHPRASSSSSSIPLAPLVAAARRAARIAAREALR